jgi:hypothetical protein
VGAQNLSGVSFIVFTGEPKINTLHTSTIVKKYSINVGYSCNFKTSYLLTKVSNHPMGENSPNLVTLLAF